MIRCPVQPPARRMIALAHARVIPSTQVNLMHQSIDAQQLAVGRTAAKLLASPLAVLLNAFCPYLAYLCSESYVIAVRSCDLGAAGLQAGHEALRVYYSHLNGGQRRRCPRSSHPVLHFLCDPLNHIHRIQGCGDVQISTHEGDAHAAVAQSSF